MLFRILSNFSLAYLVAYAGWTSQASNHQPGTPVHVYDSSIKKHSRQKAKQRSGYQVLSRTCGLPVTRPNSNIFMNLEQRNGGGNHGRGGRRSERYRVGSGSSKNRLNNIFGPLDQYLSSTGEPSASDSSVADLNDDVQLADYYSSSSVYPVTQQSSIHGQHVNPLLQLASLQTTRVVGGQEANPHSWPWQAHLSVCGKWYGRLECTICGGAIVHPRYVLTAAHCMPLDASGTIILGAHSLSTGGTQRIPVQKFILHPGWKLGGSSHNSAPFDYDIAVLILSRPAVFNDHVSPICLPSPSTCFESKTPCVVTGWGLDSELGGFPEQLQEVAVRVMDRENCKQYAGYGGNVTENMHCAGYDMGGRDACAGDSGGPLVCQVPGSSAWVLYGLVSWGYGCARPGAPGVYSNIPKLVSWISTATNGDVDYDNAEVWSQCVQYKGDYHHSSKIQAQAETVTTTSSIKPPPLKRPKTKPTTPKPMTLQTQTTTFKPATPPLNTNTCGFSIFDGSGSMKMPGFPGVYQKDKKCVWRLIPRRLGAVVKIQVPKFKLYCRGGYDDYLKITFHKSSGDEATQTCKQRRQQVINSQDPISIEFNSEHGNKRLSAFQIDYEISTPQVHSTAEHTTTQAASLTAGRPDGYNYLCGEPVHLLKSNGKRVKITSDNYPRKYTAGARCRFLLKADSAGQTVQIAVKKMITESGPDGCNRNTDNLIIMASESCDIEDLAEAPIVMGPLCGKYKRKTWSTRHRSVCVYFKADDDSRRGKFLLEAYAS